MPRKHGLITNYRELPYNPKLKVHATKMRNSSTKGEIKFWCELLRNRKSGYQFYRQKIIHHYIVDFYSAKLKKKLFVWLLFQLGLYAERLFKNQQSSVVDQDYYF